MLRAEGALGAGFARLFAAGLGFVIGREPRFALTERAGLVFVRFDLAILMASPVGRLGERPGVMARHTLVQGSWRNPSPCRDVRCAGGREEPDALGLLPNLPRREGDKGTREEPGALNFPKRAALVHPPRRSGLKAPGSLQPWLKLGLRHEAGPPPPP